MKSKVSVTVAISALNEEVNIKSLLNSVISQKGDSFILEKIIVASDGSNDSTVQKIHQIKDSRIKVINGKKRVGMCRRLNQIFKISRSDVTIKIDADVLPVDTNLIEFLVQPFLLDKKVGCVSGKAIPADDKNYIARLNNIARDVWDNVRTEFKNGNSFYSCAGQVYALSRDFLKVAIFPNDIWSDVSFIYLQCISNGFHFRSIKQAQVYIHPPQTLKEYLNQINRYEGTTLTLPNHFPMELIKKELSIPKPLLYKYKLKSLLDKPIETMLLFIINSYAKFFYPKKNQSRRATWAISKSSRKAF